MDNEVKSIYRGEFVYRNYDWEVGKTEKKGLSFTAYSGILGEQYKPCVAASASIPEMTFLATAIVRGLFRRNSLLEINMIQTTGTARVFASVAIMPQMNVSWIGAVTN